MKDINVPAGYKSTEVGVIPEDWEVNRLGEKSTKIGSGITPTGGEKVYKKQGRPFIRSQNIGWGHLSLDDIAFIDDEIHNTFKATEIKKLDVFLNITGASIGRSAVADYRVENGNVNQHVCIIRTNQKELNSFFLNHCLLSDKGQKQIDSFQAGGNREGLNFGQIKSLKIPFPTLPEQKAIATALSDIDNLLGVLDRLIAKKQNLKQSAMQELLTGKKRLPGFREGKGYKQTEVGLIPKDWEIATLGEIGKFKNGINKNKESFGFGFPFVNLLDVFGKIKISDSLTLGLINSTKIERNEYNLKKGDVIFVRSSVKPEGVGLTSVAVENLENAVYSGFLIRFRDESNFDLEYKVHCFYEEEFRKRLIDNSTVSANTNINQDALKKLKLPLPPLPEQKAIATILSDIDTEIAALKKRRDKTHNIKQAMMQELLTGKTRLVSTGSR